jgi:hypothetical protein
MSLYPKSLAYPCLHCTRSQKQSRKPGSDQVAETRRTVDSEDEVENQNAYASDGAALGLSRSDSPRAQEFADSFPMRRGAAASVAPHPSAMSAPRTMQPTHALQSLVRLPSSGAAAAATATANTRHGRWRRSESPRSEQSTQQAALFDTLFDDMFSFRGSPDADTSSSSVHFHRGDSQDVDGFGDSESQSSTTGHVESSSDDGSSRSRRGSATFSAARRGPGRPPKHADGRQSARLSDDASTIRLNLPDYRSRDRAL